MTSYGSRAVLTARPSTIALNHLHISTNLASDCDSIASVNWACFCCFYSQGLPPNLHHLLCIPLPAVNCFAGYVKISVPEGGQGSLKSYVLLLPCVGCLIIGSDSWSLPGFNPYLVNLLKVFAMSLTAKETKFVLVTKCNLRVKSSTLHDKLFIPQF